MKVYLGASYILEVFVIAFIAFFCYGWSLHGSFVFDDYEAIVNNNDVKLESNLSDLLKHDFWGTNLSSNTSHKSYRPLTILSFRINNYISGSLNCTHMKITNFCIYLAVCFLVYIMFNLIIVGYSRIPFIATVLFTSHPIHIEAVSSLVGRAELLSGLFYCLAFIFYIQSIGRDKTLHIIFHCICSCLCALLSLLSKENGVTIVLVCILYDLMLMEDIRKNMHWKYSKDTKNMLIRFSILILSIISLLYWRLSIMDFRPPIFQKMDNHIAFTDNITIKISSQIYLYALNMWLLICPNWLCCDWSFECIPLITGYDLRILATLLPWIVIGTILYYGNMLLKVGLIFMVIPFLPASGIITVGFVIAERVLFLPSIGYCLIVGTCVQKSFRLYDKVPLLCFFVLICTWIGRSNLRAAEWSNSTILYESAAKVCPGNAKIHYNRALTAAVNGDFNSSESMYMEALRLYPEYEQALNNLANLLRESGRIDEAEIYLRKAIKIRPSFGAAWMNLGIVLSHAGSYSEAEDCYKKSLQIRPNHADSHFNLGNLYLNSKRYSDAKMSWYQATKLNPKHVKSWINLLTLLDSQGKFDEVHNVADKALRVLPFEPGLHFILANSLGKAGLYDIAEKHFKIAIDMKQDQLYYTNLGVLYHRWNKTKEAASMYKEALRLNPKLKSAKENYEKLLKGADTH